jgi:5-methylcytosine-specific restriction endonuclease McrA
MHRHLGHLSSQEQEFIHNVYILLKTHQQTADELGIDISEIKRFNKELDSTWRPITKIRYVWKVKKIGGNFWDFYDWHQTSEKACHYCGITQEQLDLLHQNKKVYTKRNRGRLLEIDRKIADQEYNNLKNLTFCCYWCNNAKTDTFSEEEFKIIGQAIASVWKKRLENDTRPGN